MKILLLIILLSYPYNIHAEEWDLDIPPDDPEIQFIEIKPNPPPSKNCDQYLVTCSGSYCYGYDENCNLVKESLWLSAQCSSDETPFWTDDCDYFCVNNADVVSGRVDLSIAHEFAPEKCFELPEGMK